MDVIVIDLEGQSHPFSWAEQEYGVSFRRAEPGPDGKVFRLWKLVEKGGPCGGYPEVWWQEPKPYSGVFVAAHWPGAPDPPEGGVWAAPRYWPDVDWYPNYVAGKTNAEGIAGFGWDGNAHGRGEGGAYSFWVHHEHIPSDVSERHGWLAGTFHHALHPIFLLEEEMSEQAFVLLEDPTFDPTEGTRHIRIDVEGERNLQGLFWSVGVENLELEDGTTAPSDWEAGPYPPTSDEHIYMGADYTVQPDEVARTFWVTIQDQEGTILGGPYYFRFESDRGGIWKARVAWQSQEPEEPPEEEPGEPPEEPTLPPDDVDNLAALFLDMAQVLAKATEICQRIAALLGEVSKA